jgi:hypothetical protein
MSTSKDLDEKDRRSAYERDPASSSGRDPLGPVLESFLTRFRKGERPALAEYIERYPALADQIRELLPALVEMEQLGSLGGSPEQSNAGMAASEKPRAAPAVASATDATEPAASGDNTGAWPQRLGDYRILACIGEGGMGAGAPHQDGEFE